MANQRRTQTAASINEVAARWLLRLEESDSPELRQDFQKWLNAEPRHRVAYLRLESAWFTSEKLRLFRPHDGSVDEDLITKL